MAKTHYPDVNPNPDFPAIEQAVIGFWQRENIFQRSVENRVGAEEFIFYDGPPFANGLPHYGHLLTGFVKDLFARYETMKGRRVERRFGWDCHGLPAEMGSEKELGISGRQAIMAFGIDRFNAHCRTSVMKYTREWEEYVTRQARWVDFKNDYKTMNTGFMESVLWAFSQLYDKGLIYEAYRVMPYSWAAETPLSNFETKLDNSYREREDKAITVAFELNTPPHGAPKADKYYVLAWTTTPWTLPSNLALAVNKEMEYFYAFPLRGEADANASGGGVCYIIGKNALKKYEKELAPSPTLPPLGGGSLIGLSYHPLFPYFATHKHAFKILDGSSFVTDADGTGIVHLAPGFGEDDQKCCEANGIEIVVPVDGQGKYTDDIFDLSIPSPPLPNPLPQAGEGSNGKAVVGEPVLLLRGLNVIAEKTKSPDDPFNEKQIEKYGLANLRIIHYLKKNYPDGTNRVIQEQEIKHNYPHCWRTDQPLIYRAMPSWYVEVTKFRDRAVEINQQINWIPEHIRDGQMGHMLATAPDWSISRNRFWGTPIPVWRSKSGKIKVFGSIAALEAASGQTITDLHRPTIDEIIITEGGEEYRRVEDVFDCWFESGSMPFAQVHYPFENKDWFENHFPADFITEYVGQTRGWFNTLIMLSTALFDKPPFMNCICHGVVLDSETGLKYSKRLKNYKDPMEVMDKFGADALRWLMISSPVMRGMDLAVDPDGKFIRDVVRLAIKPIWNAYNFFCLYANADGIKASSSRGYAEAGISCQSEGDPRFAPRAREDDINVMDRYILAKCRHATEAIEQALDDYDTPSACDAVMQFFEALNNWYIRRNKERFWNTDKANPDKQSAYDTLYTVLTTMCRAAAPLLPLTLEEIYRGLTGKESVHLADFPSSSARRKPSPGIHLKTSARDELDPRLALRAPEDDELIAQMDWIRDVCNAALAIRNKTNIRVRQPLRSIELAGDKVFYLTRISGSVWGTLADVIRDEINVKEVNLGTTFTSYATLKLSINNPVLGKRLPEKMKQIIPASKKGEWKQLADGGVEICGETLLPGEYTLQLEPKPEYASRAQALSTNDALVILDITLTPELEAEGVARDLVRMIQQARKEANLKVSDRIALHLDAPKHIMQAVKTHECYIMEQTLSVALLEGKPAGPEFSAEHMLEGQKIVISLAVSK